MTPFFQGIFVALTTPYRGSHLDEDALQRHVAWLVAQGIQGVVPCGTTGEGIALSPTEKGRVIEVCVNACAGRAKVIPGIGMPTTGQTLEAAQQAEALGADGLLVLTPYFVRANQEGLIQHYQTLHQATKLPLILYNNPSRTGADLSLETICHLSQFPRVMGLKEASYDLARPLVLKQSLGSSFTLLSGEDNTFPAFLAQGGDGIISVTAGVAPHLVKGVWEAWKAGDLKSFLAFRHRLSSLNQVLFSTTNPMGIKYAAHLLGFGSAETRLPLLPLTATHQQALAAVLKAEKSQDHV